VALKVLGSVIDFSQVERFRREAAAVSRLDHPGICPVYEAGEADGTQFIAMRYIDGVSLAQIIAREKEPGAETSSIGPETRAQVDDVLLLVERVARALHSAHEAGLVHRDIKPGNIMVDREQRPIILDFGLARDETGNLKTLTIEGDLLGTPAYMSPEQLVAHRIKLDRRTDVYSLGVTLFECLTLQRPFDGATREALYKQILTTQLPDPRRMNRVLNKDLKVVLETACEKDRDRRYQTALDLAEDLRRVRAFEPIQARPLGAMVRLRRWTQRRPALATGILSLFLLLVTGLGVALGMLDEVRTSQRATESALEQAKADRDLARQADERSKDALARSYYQQARMLRHSRELSRRERATKLLQRAAALVVRNPDAPRPVDPKYPMIPAETGLPTLAQIRAEFVQLLLEPDVRENGLKRLPRAHRTPHFKNFQLGIGERFVIEYEHPGHRKQLEKRRGKKVPQLERIRVFDLEKHREVHDYEFRHFGGRIPVAVGYDGVRAVFHDPKREGSEGYSIWDLATGKLERVLAIPDGFRLWSHNERIRVLSPTGRYFATPILGRGYTFFVWDLSTGEPPVEFRIDHEGRSDMNGIGIEFDPQETRVVLALGRTVAVLDLKSAKTLAKQTFPEKLCCPPRFVTRGVVLVAREDAGLRKRIGIWDLEKNKVRTFQSDAGRVNAMSYRRREGLPDLIAVVGIRGVTVHRASDGEQIHRFPNKHGTGATDAWARWSDDGLTLEVGGFGHPETWDLVPPAGVRTSRSHTGPRARRSLAAYEALRREGKSFGVDPSRTFLSKTADGRFFVSYVSRGKLGQVAIHERGGKDPIYLFREHPVHKRAVTRLRILPDNRLVVSHKGGAICARIPSGEVEWELEFKGSQSFAPMPSPDKDLVFIVRKNHLVVWSMRAGRPVLYLPNDPYPQFSFARDGLEMTLDCEDRALTWHLDRVRSALAQAGFDW
jgi:WD40 repeat protein